MNVVDDEHIAFICGKGIKFLNIVNGREQYWWPPMYNTIDQERHSRSTRRGSHAYRNKSDEQLLEEVNDLGQRENTRQTEIGTPQSTSSRVDLQNLNISGTSVIAFHQKSHVFAVGEKGLRPKIHIYSYDLDYSNDIFMFQHRQTLLEATTMEFNDFQFSRDGEYLVALGAIPDHTISIWDWENEKCLVQHNAPEQCRNITFNPRNKHQLCSTGISGHIQFWEMQKMTGDDFHLSPMYVKVFLFLVRLRS